jgi:hypothetical protein
MMLDDWKDLVVNEVSNRIADKNFLFAQESVNVIVVNTLEFCHGGKGKLCGEFANGPIDPRIYDMLSIHIDRIGATKLLLRKKYKKINGKSKQMPIHPIVLIKFPKVYW